MKKVLSIFFVLFFVIGLFTGCQGSVSDFNESSNNKIEFDGLSMEIPNTWKFNEELSTDSELYYQKWDESENVISLLYIQKVNNEIYEVTQDEYFNSFTNSYIESSGSAITKELEDTTVNDIPAKTFEFTTTNDVNQEYNGISYLFSYRNDEYVSKYNDFIIITFLTAQNNQKDFNSCMSTLKLDTNEKEAEVIKNVLKDGEYKVGSDIKKGEYVLISNSTKIKAYYEVKTKNNKDIKSNGIFNKNVYVTVKDGEYLTLKDCKAYPIKYAPEIDTTGEGMYKVGRDIKAGEYKLNAVKDGYYEITNDSEHTSIVDNEIFTGDKYVTVKDGQYLTLSNSACILSD